MNKVIEDAVFALSRTTENLSWKWKTLESDDENNF